MIEIKYVYDTEQEMKDDFRERDIDRAARRVLSQLRQELRSTIKHGEPTDRDEYWYKRLFELASQEESIDIDAWEF